MVVWALVAVAGLPALVRHSHRSRDAALPAVGTPPLVLPTITDPAPPEVPGWRISDALDPASPDPESAHEYRISADAGFTPGPLLDPSARRMVSDAGRSTAGRETFQLSCRRDRPVILLARLSSLSGGRLRVRWNGSPQRSVRLSGDARRFQTILIAEDRGQLVGERNRIDVVREDGSRIAAHHYWALQPR